jgi:homoserine O-acetyltransferase
MKTLLVILFLASVGAAQNYPTPTPGDFVMRDFKFQSGENLAEVKMHYVTLGTAVKDKNGNTANAVLILHGTGGSHANLLRPSFAGALFGKGQLLDAEKYFIVIPDNVGHGASSKPSDGLRAKFPHYNYHDLVTAQYRLLTEKLGVDHLRLVMGTSMGGMHSWMWPEMYPDFMDAAMPLASLPVEIAGRNRIWRRMVIDSIKNDPDWQNGEYKTPPLRGLTAAVNILTLMGSVPLQMQKQAPTKDAADKMYDESIKTRVQAYEANDVIYHFDASRDYNPAPKLEAIKAHLIAVNSADDEINPPELGIAEREIKRVKNGKFILLPISDETRGHGSHTVAALWQKYLAELLAASEKK